MGALETPHRALFRFSFQVFRSNLTFPPLFKESSAAFKASSLFQYPFVSQQILRMRFSFVAFSNAKRLVLRACGICAEGSPPKKHMHETWESALAARLSALITG